MGVRLPPFALLAFGEECPERAKRVEGLLLALLLSVATLSAQTPLGALIPIFDAYERGRYVEAISDLTRHADLKTLKAQIAMPHESGEWIRAGGTTSADRRRVIVATVAIEAANRHGLSQWGDAIALIEWACVFVRQNVPGAAEAAWQRASIALMLTGAGPHSDHAEVHVGHAFRRFPADPQVVLARGVARELRTFPDPRDGGTLNDRDGRVDQIIDYLQDARIHPAVRPEASVRLGFLFLRLNQPALALTTLEDGTRESGDPQIEYLAHLFRGRALERLGRHAEAVEAYRGATKAVPGAQTAALGLAAALVKVGDRTAGAAIAQQAVMIPAPPLDPWFVYGKIATRQWPALLESLRSALR